MPKRTWRASAETIALGRSFIRAYRLTAVDKPDFDKVEAVDCIRAILDWAQAESGIVAADILAEV